MLFSCRPSMFLFTEYYPLQREGESLYLSPDRFVWWPAMSMVLVADLHLGKATHFNRNGQALPNNAARRDLIRLHQVCELLEARRLIVLGDLFHSEYNNEFALLGELAAALPSMQMEVVRGNHDILSAAHYEKLGIVLHEHSLNLGPFCFVHDPVEALDGTAYRVGGHLHPGVMLRGKGRDYLKLPCFYAGRDYLVLPAFGSLTGLAKMEAIHPEDRIIAIAGEKLVELPNPIKTQG